MARYVLWLQGLKRAYPALLIDRKADSPNLTEYERRGKIGDAMLIAEEHAGIRYIDELARLYPCPGSPREHLMKGYNELLAAAASPGATPEQRDAARAKAKIIWDKMGEEGL